MKRKHGSSWTYVPAWLADPDGVAPCLCGRPLARDEIPIVALGEHDMKRWFHIRCWNMWAGDEYEYDEDDDE